MSGDNLLELAGKLDFPLENLQLLREAVTHRTYAVEHNLNYDNQRLEFLGDSVLEIIQTEYLFYRLPDLPEGDLTKIRAAMSCEHSFAELARHLALGQYLLSGKGEKNEHGNERDSTLCDLFEAVIGALYLGAGMAKVKVMVEALLDRFYPEPRGLLFTQNPKGRLQELGQGRWGRTPVYTLLRCGGPQHCPFFEVEAELANFIAVGCGGNRKSAEIAAAAKLLRYFVAAGYIIPTD